MAATPDKLRKALAAAELAPVWLLAGEEPLLLQEAADALRVCARGRGFVEREVLDVDARFDWERLAGTANNLSLFASRRLIELRLPTGRPDKDGAAAITAWCAAPPSDTLLLIAASEWSRKHETAWVKAVERVGVYAPLWPPKPEQLPEWIEARMRAHGFQPDRDAVALLIARGEGNLLAIAQEIDKLVLLHAPGRVDAEALQAMIADSARFDAFQLAAAALSGDAARTLRVCAGLRAEGEDVIPLLSLVQRDLGIAMRLSEARDFDAAARAEGLWDARARPFRAALRRAGSAHWQRCLAWCAHIDRVAKGQEFDQAGRSIGDVWREFERLLLAVAEPGAADALAA